MTFFLQLVHLAQRADLTVFLRVDAFTGILQHGVAVQRDIRAAPGVLCGGQVVSVGLAGNLEDRQGHLFGKVRAIGEPLTFSPGLDDFLGLGVAGFHLVFHIVESIKYQQSVLEFVSSDFCQFGIIQR